MGGGGNNGGWAKRHAARLVDARRERAAEVRRHEAALRRIDRKIEALEARVVAPVAADLDPHRQAGPGNVERMRGVFQRLGTATAAEATREAGYPAGHQVWAIRA